MGETNVIDKYFSKELTYILDYIIENVNEDMHFNEISPYIFLYSALEKQESMLYTVLSSYLITEMIDKIHDTLIDYANMETINASKFSPAHGKPEISQRLRYILNDSLYEVRETNTELINSDHVLLAILNESEKGYEDTDHKISILFRDYGVSYAVLLNLSKSIREAIKESDNEDTKGKTANEDNKPEEAKKIETLAEAFSKNIKIIDKIKAPNGGTLIISEGQIPIDQAEILSNMFGGLPIPTGQQKQNNGNSKTIPFCTNINEQVKKGKFDDLVGRDKEVDEIFRVLGRRKTNNAILVGENGVGKTQIVIGLVQRIMSGESPIMFKDKEVWKFNPTEMLAGTTLRGMFEERMIGMIKILKENKNAILFIDDIHNLFAEKSKGDFDAGGVISELLSNGDVQVIAACDYKGYKVMSDSAQSITKKLQKITVDPLDDESTYDILADNKKYYEKYHNVTYSEDILRKCISLSKRYITEKSLPSSAIDILDELGSYKKMNNDLANSIKWHYMDLNGVKDVIDKASKKDDFDKVREYQRIENDIRCDLARMEEEMRKSPKISVTEEDLYTTISQHTNIPIGKLKSDDKQELKKIDAKLKSVIIGQDEAIDVVSRAIKRNKIGLHQTKKPISTFFFVGPTGTGKTLLAKTLAKEIFGDEKYLIRFDMSEYNDKTSVNKLIGASAGYVGYNEGGLLTEAVKNNKYAVLLIDEIEKATDEVYNLFLQVFDEGFMTDNTGQKVDFKNTIIIMTSNVGTKKAGQHKSLGFEASDDDRTKHNIITKEMKDKFPPEFLNRIDEIVYFNSLSDNNLKEIIKLEMNKLNDRLSNINQTMVYNNSVVEFILNQVKDEKEYGARPIIRAIRENVENKITDLIIDNDYEGHMFNVTMENNEIKVH